MKVALCFIISYDHILNKEHIWKEWIKHNSDIINVYFYYKDYKKIKSSWILNHIIPKNMIEETSYYQVIPAYINLIRYARYHDNNNEWLCFLTDSCCPIISPKKFRHLFFNYFHKSILNWKPPWWNINLQKRANLACLNEQLRLANDPYFILCKQQADIILNFKLHHKRVFHIVNNGGLANESIFAIALKQYNELENTIQSVTHIADWSRMMSATSPYLFHEENAQDNIFIEKNISDNPYAMFIRKVHSNYSDKVLSYYIYEYNKKNEYFLITFDLHTFYMLFWVITFIILTLPTITTLYT